MSNTNMKTWFFILSEIVLEELSASATAKSELKVVLIDYLS